MAKCCLYFIKQASGLRRTFIGRLQTACEEYGRKAGFQVFIAVLIEMVRITPLSVICSGEETHCAETYYSDDW